jgi:hypothetical protein
VLLLVVVVVVVVAVIVVVAIVVVLIAGNSDCVAHLKILWLSHEPVLLWCSTR